MKRFYLLIAVLIALSLSGGEYQNGGSANGWIGYPQLLSFEFGLYYFPLYIGVEPGILCGKINLGIGIRRGRSQYVFVSTETWHLVLQGSSMWRWWEKNNRGDLLHYWGMELRVTKFIFSGRVGWFKGSNGGGRLLSLSGGISF